MVDKKLTLGKAVKQHCIDCIYDSKAGGSHVQQIENCSIVKCALYSFRQITTATKEINRLKMVENMGEKERQVYEKKREILKERILTSLHGKN